MIRNHIINMKKRVTNYGGRVLDPASGIMRNIGINFIKGSILFVNGIIICELNSRKWAYSINTKDDNDKDNDNDNTL